MKSKGFLTFPQTVETLARKAGDVSSIPGKRNSYPLQYSCLENFADRGDWQSPWNLKESDTTEQQHTTKTTLHSNYLLFVDKYVSFIHLRQYLSVTYYVSKVFLDTCNISVNKTNEDS